MNILSKLYYSHKARKFGFENVDEYLKFVRKCCMHRDWVGVVVLTGRHASKVVEEDVDYDEN